jgi:hypothetical protein
VLAEREVFFAPRIGLRRSFMAGNDVIPLALFNDGYEWVIKFQNIRESAGVLFLEAK